MTEGNCITCLSWTSRSIVFYVSGIFSLVHSNHSGLNFFIAKFAFTQTSLSWMRLWGLDHWYKNLLQTLHSLRQACREWGCGDWITGMCWSSHFPRLRVSKVWLWWKNKVGRQPPSDSHGNLAPDCSFTLHRVFIKLLLLLRTPTSRFLLHQLGLTYFCLVEFKSTDLWVLLSSPELWEPGVWVSEPAKCTRRTLWLWEAVLGASVLLGLFTGKLQLMLDCLEIFNKIPRVRNRGKIFTCSIFDVRGPSLLA